MCIRDRSKADQAIKIKRILEVKPASKTPKAKYVGYTERFGQDREVKFRENERFIYAYERMERRTDAPDDDGADGCGKGEEEKREEEGEEILSLIHI